MRTVHCACFKNSNDLLYGCSIYQRVAWAVEEQVQGHTVDERVNQGHALTAWVLSFFPVIKMKIFLVSVGMKDRCVSNLGSG